jgi:hypothetical protein
VDYETAQKEITSKVKAYLADMDIDQYWIDRMLSANSQEYYMPTWDEADSKVHHLIGMVPSLEEVVLSKCGDGDPHVDRNVSALRNPGRPLSSEDQAKIDQLSQDSEVFLQCKKTVLSDMQKAAFERENEGILKEKCKQFPPLAPGEMSRLKELLQRGANVTHEEEATSNQLFLKDLSYRQCRGPEEYAIWFATYKNWSDELEASKRAAHTQTYDDFDAKDLSPETMAKKGKEAYEAENYEAALRWFRRAADLGNADAMMGMSWIYGNGRGVPEDDAEAMRWRKMSAEHGNLVAMNSIAGSYEQGEGVPQDYVQAMEWYKEAADRDDTDAMRSIAYLYERGRGVAQDYAEAMGWYRKAADRGDAQAMWSIGSYYEFGLGVPTDEAQARVWMKKAAASGYIEASEWLIEHP